MRSCAGSQVSARLARDAAPAEANRIDAFRRRAELCRVLTDPKRLLILDALRDGERSVGELADALGCTLPNTSQHLAQLRAAGLVAGRREGTTVHYRLAEPRILQACDVVGAIVGEAPTVHYRLAEPRILQACDVVGAIVGEATATEPPRRTA